MNVLNNGIKDFMSIMLQAAKTSIKPQILKRCKKFCSTTFNELNVTAKMNGSMRYN
jgi:hypothetical protein